MNAKVFSLVMVALAFQTAAPAQPSTGGPVANPSLVSRTYHVSTPFSHPQTKEPYKGDRVRDMNGESWTQIAGWHSGDSAFPYAQKHQSRFWLLSVGAQSPD